MCLLCIEWEQERMTNSEAITAIGEMVEYEQDEEKRHHLFGLINRVMDDEDAKTDYADTEYLEDLDEDDSECQ